MNTPATARKGVYAGVAGTAIAVGVTWAEPSVIHHVWIILAIVAGFVVGVPLSRVPLTAVPQRTALSHAFGGAGGRPGGHRRVLPAAGRGRRHLTAFRMVALIAEVLLGYLTFTGSLMAAGKLQEVKWVPQRPVTYPLQNVSNLLLFGAGVALAAALTIHPTAPWAPLVFPVIIVLALVFGVLLDHPDRRRGHADGDRDPELVRRPLGGRDGLRARQQAADHGRRARRIERPHPRDHHVQGDEPVVHERAVRRVRPGAAGQGDRRGGRSTSRKRPKARRRCWSRRAWS